jgi:hypothetical protein
MISLDVERGRADGTRLGLHVTRVSTHDGGPLGAPERDVSLC